MKSLMKLPFIIHTFAVVALFAAVWVASGWGYAVLGAAIGFGMKEK